MKRQHHLQLFGGPAGLPGPMCPINVTHVKKTSIRELKHDTSRVLSWVAGGETVEVFRRNVPVAVLSPPGLPADVTRPDFAARLREIYGDKVLPTTGTDLVSGSRGES